MIRIMIGSSNNARAVKEQYASADGLNTRLSFHEKYSVNRQGYGNWILSNYDIREGMRVLELGCGTGSMWRGHGALMAKCGKLVLTDLSEGMLAAARENLSGYPNTAFSRADIQEIPFEKGSFDIVIANSMLYHVPHIERAIREVRRVLKAEGAFYCATMGENNFPEKLAEWFALEGERFVPNHNFTLQNGAAKLRAAFSDVRALAYADSLHVTDVEDLVQYLLSLAPFKSVLDLPAERIRKILTDHAVGGAVDLPKEYGLFICKGSAF